MKKRAWMLSVGVLAVAVAGVLPALAQAPEETTERPTEYCGICDAKQRAHDLLGDFMEFGVDFRARVTHVNNAAVNSTATPKANRIGLNKKQPNHEELFQRYRSRLWTQIRPVDDIEIGARLVWEFFNICLPKAADNTPSSDVTFDQLYLKWSKILETPFAVTAGRQTMRLGDGWLVFEGTPLDGSRTVYFDAIRMTYDLKDYDTKIDGIFIANRAKTNMYIKPFNYGAVERRISETDEMAAILYASNTSREKMVLDGYFIYVNRQEPSASNTVADLYTLGGRVDGVWSERIKYRGETALQFGKKELSDGRNTSLCPQVGMVGEVTYLLLDSLDTALHAGYEYRSGDKNPEKGFDILFGRYPQWSELLNGRLDSLEEPPGAGTNFHRLNLGVDFKPCEKSLLLLDWHILFADNNNQLRTDGYSEDGCLRGNLFTAQWKITHNKHMASQITGELFLPGDYYNSDRNDPATFARYELMLTW